MLDRDSDVAPVNGAWRNSAKRAEAMAAARRMIEGTTIPQGEIAFRVGVSPQTLSDWKVQGNWTRPEGAPEAPPKVPLTSAEEREAARRERLVQRLFRVFDRHLMDIESRAASANGTTEEKDARALGTLARTLGTLDHFRHIPFRDRRADHAYDRQPAGQDRLNALRAKAFSGCSCSAP